MNNNLVLNGVGIRDKFFLNTHVMVLNLEEKIKTSLYIFKDAIEGYNIYNFSYIPAKGIQIYKNKELRV